MLKYIIATQFFTVCLGVILPPIIQEGGNREVGYLSGRSFTLGKNCFLKDGKPFRYISGSFHYWRQPPEYWEDTFKKMRAAGLSAVQTYVHWALHEPEQGKFNFGGSVDLKRFIRSAQKEGLLVILRLGPFIDAEVDMGALPYWLWNINPDMKLRSNDPSFMEAVNGWWSKVLLPLVKPLLYANGGPVITVQVENEYGSYGSDKTYKQALRDIVVSGLGNDVILFTTDGNGLPYLAGGRIDGTLSTIDFGAGDAVDLSFAALRVYNPDGPLVNSEFYPGWLDHWGSPFNTVDYPVIIKTLTEILNRNASVNTYMFYGGSNFGFVAGANEDPEYDPIITSYDYDAPISEAGDTTSPKYLAYRELLGKYVPLPPDPIPPSRPKAAYGKVILDHMGSLYDFLDVLIPKKPVISNLPLSFEELKHPFGFVLYRNNITKDFGPSALLTVDNLHDRAVVLIDQKPVGILSRTSHTNTILVPVQKGSTVDLLVQNEGRNCFGNLDDKKGILGDVKINGFILTTWEMYPLDLPGFPVDNPKPFNFARGKTSEQFLREANYSGPAFYAGSLNVDVAQDTFLNMKGWTGGYAFVNGRNLGRYWPARGPQITLYVPGVYLKQGQPNLIDLFELESPFCNQGDCTVEFVDKPILNGTSCHNSTGCRTRKVDFARRHNTFRN